MRRPFQGICEKLPDMGRPLSTAAGTRLGPLLAAQTKLSLSFPIGKGADLLPQQGFLHPRRTPHHLLRSVFRCPCSGRPCHLKCMPKSYVNVSLVALGFCNCSLEPPTATILPSRSCPWSASLRPGSQAHNGLHEK